MNKSRRAGFTGTRDTRASFFDYAERYRAAARHPVSARGQLDVRLDGRLGVMSRLQRRRGLVDAEALRHDLRQVDTALGQEPQRLRPHARVTRSTR